MKRLPPAARERALLGGYLFYRGGCLLDFGGFPAGAAAFTSYCSLLRFQTKCHHKGLGLSKQDKPRSLGQLPFELQSSAYSPAPTIHKNLDHTTLT